MHEISQNDGNLITVRVRGKLTAADYKDLVPAWQRVIDEHGSMRMLFVMEDFHGWEPGAAWDDFRFETGHADSVERVAMVGEKSWESWLTRVGSLFAPERVRYFDLSDLKEAEHWVRAG
jgi:hypothetical protein